MKSAIIDSILKESKIARKLSFKSLFSTPANEYGLILPSISSEPLMAAEMIKSTFDYIKDDAPVSCYIPTTRARQWQEKKYIKSVLKYEGEWKPEYSAIHAGRRRQKQQDWLSGNPLRQMLNLPVSTEQKAFPDDVKRVFSKYENELKQKGVIQIRFGREFIENSYALALDKNDLLTLARTRSHKGLQMWDVPMSNRIYQDPETKVYWINTGSFD